VVEKRNSSSIVHARKDRKDAQAMRLFSLMTTAKATDQTEGNLTRSVHEPRAPKKAAQLFSLRLEVIRGFV
jgi:hypothetical protein